MNQRNFQINDIRELEEVVRRLRALSRRYQDFFQLQFQRLGSHMQAQQQMVDRADAVRSMLDDIQSQKDSWDSVRNAEMQRIDDASQKLMQAWQALEEQQRQALLQQPTSKPAVASPVSQPLNPQPAAVAPPPQPAQGTIPLTGFMSHEQSRDFAAAQAHVSSTGQPQPYQAIQPAAVPAPVNHQPVHNTNGAASHPEPEPVDAETAKFEYEQLKRQMRAHANRQS